MLVLELKEVVLLFKVAHAAVDGTYEDLAVFLSMFHSKVDPVGNTGKSILSIVEAIVPYCPALHNTSCIAIHHVPGLVGQKLLSSSIATGCSVLVFVRTATSLL